MQDKMLLYKFHISYVMTIYVFSRRNNHFAESSLFISSYYVSTRFRECFIQIIVIISHWRILALIKISCFQERGDGFLGMLLNVGRGFSTIIRTLDSSIGLLSIIVWTRSHSITRIVSRIVHVAFYCLFISLLFL